MLFLCVSPAHVDILMMEEISSAKVTLVEECIVGVGPAVDPRRSLRSWLVVDHAGFAKNVMGFICLDFEYDSQTHHPHLFREQLKPCHPQLLLKTQKRG